MIDISWEDSSSKMHLLSNIAFLWQEKWINENKITIIYHVFSNKSPNGWQTEAVKREVSFIQRQVPRNGWTHSKIFWPYDLHSNNDNYRFSWSQISFSHEQKDLLIGQKTTSLFTSKPAFFRASMHCPVNLMSGRPSPISISALKKLKFVKLTYYFQIN